MVTSWSISIQIGQTTPHFWTSFPAQASRNGPEVFLKIFLSIFSIFIMLILISLPKINTYWLWYTLLAMFSCSAVIQSIISYLTSKKIILHVMLILYDAKLIISHLFDVQKENIARRVSHSSCTPFLRSFLVRRWYRVLFLIWRQKKILHVYASCVPLWSRVLFLIWRQKRKHYM